MPARIATPITRSSGSPRPTRPRGFSGEQLMINYNSALKVVNLGEPEASLILRKPRSPQGQGARRASQPDGLVSRRRAAVGKHRASRLTARSSTGSAKRRRSARPRTRTESSPPTATRPVTSRPRPATATSPRSGTPSSSARRPDIRTSWSSISGAPRRVEGLLYVPRQDMLQRPRQGLRDPRLRRRQDLERAHRSRAMGQRPVLQVCRSSRLARPATSSFAA